MWHRLAKLVQINYVRTLEMIPKERFQFPQSIDEKETCLLVKKTQDGLMEDIYNLNTVIWSENHVKSPMAQSVRQDSLFVEDSQFTKI